jgi:hypothetical protein
MPAVNIATNETEHLGLLEQFRETPRVVPKILAMGLNETAKKTKVRISRRIRDKVNIKKADVDKFITRTRAKPDRLEASIRLSESDRLPLKYFGARQVRGNSKGAGGVTYKIEREGERKKVEGGFISEKLGGHAYKRLGKERLPIAKLHGPSAWGVFTVSKMTVDTIVDIEREMDFQLNRAANFFEKQLSGELPPRAFDFDVFDAIESTETVGGES